MGHPKAGVPESGAPVKYFAALLLSEGAVRPEADTGIGGVIPALEEIFGPVDYAGKQFPFDMTDYYEDEMGPGVSRMILSFEVLGEATDLVKIKHATRSVEEKFSSGGCRTVNIDPGYIDFFKVVLASFKEGPQKVYIGDGVYADPVMMYQDGEWMALPWTFPDFRTGLYNGDLSAIRRIYKKQRRSAEPG